MSNPNYTTPPPPWQFVLRPEPGTDMETGRRRLRSEMSPGMQIVVIVKPAGDVPEAIDVRRLPRAPVAMLVDHADSLERAIANGWKNIHLCHGLLDEPTARRLHAAGISIAVWTVNTARDLH